MCGYLWTLGFSRWSYGTSCLYTPSCSMLDGFCFFNAMYEFRNWMVAHERYSHGVDLLGCDHGNLAGILASLSIFSTPVRPCLERFYRVVCSSLVISILRGGIDKANAESYREEQLRTEAERLREPTAGPQPKPPSRCYGGFMECISRKVDRGLVDACPETLFPSSIQGSSLLWRCL